ncbi:hypothetical protein TMatcc_008517 [Talaromyces marneffei ATCC 18224]|nr:uncharacterized protein EYB26_007849 [Talaromyces marneffei]KAE8550480.1 hypothetical protein EYB25_006707 [Talaromyces marneffei]QGA20148.1 hypothetical protein EYB26_007849 [Talaromyces marneffei]
MVNYQKIIRSPHFTFLVGHDKTPLTIHTAVVENLSAPLSSLMNNGSMLESHTKTCTLEDVEASTFIGFCEFLYTGQYVTPTKEGDERVEAGSKMEGQLDKAAVNSGFVSPINKKKHKNKLANRSSFYRNLDEWGYTEIEKNGNNYFFTDLWEKFISLKFDGALAKICSEPDILFHAKCYTFATKYLIEPLRQQSLATLHRDLCAYPLSSPKTTNPKMILELLDFVYTNTGRAEPEGQSAIRDLVIHYVACKLRILSENENFFTILDSDAEMGSDLVKKLLI